MARADLYSRSLKSPLGGVGGEEQVLAEAQRLAGICLVEGHDVGHGLDIGVGRPVLQIEIEIALQLIDENDRWRRRIALVVA
jgi:hypothetical protein